MTLPSIERDGGAAIAKVDQSKRWTQMHLIGPYVAGVLKGVLERNG